MGRSWTWTGATPGRCSRGGRGGGPAFAAPRPVRAPGQTRACPRGPRAGTRGHSPPAAVAACRSTNTRVVAMIEQLPGGGGKVLGFRLSGKLHDEDYKQFVPAIDAAVAQHGKVRLLAEFHDF